MAEHHKRKIKWPWIKHMLRKKTKTKTKHKAKNRTEKERQMEKEEKLANFWKKNKTVGEKQNKRVL